MPDPVEGAGAYVAAAYIVFVTLVVIYVAIIGSRVARMERELETLGELVEKRSASEREAVAAATAGSES